LVDKTQPERQRRYRAKLKDKIKQELPALRSRVAELEAEVAALNRRLAEASDTPAQPSLLDKFSPEERAEFDLMHSGAKGPFKDKVGNDALVYFAKFCLLQNAKRRRERDLAKEKTGASTVILAPERDVTPAPPLVKKQMAADTPFSPDQEADLDKLAAVVPDQMSIPELESEEDFFARLKAIRDDPNKPPAEKQREQQAVLKARDERWHAMRHMEELNRRWRGETRLDWQKRQDEELMADLENFDIPDKAEDDLKELEQNK
jgi:hypothetical protein